jgi:hypothetical protein
MPMWGRNEGRKTRDEGKGFNLHRRSAVRPRLLEVQPDVFIVEDLQAVIGERRAKDVLAQG